MGYKESTPQEICVALASKSMVKHQQTYIENKISPNLAIETKKMHVC